MGDEDVEIDGDSLEQELIEYFRDYAVPEGAVTVTALCEKTGQTTEVVRRELETRVKNGELDKKKVGNVMYYYRKLS